MWKHEYSGTTAASPEAVWRILEDLKNWPEWDTSMEWVRPLGPFSAGTKVVMKPLGQDPVTSTILRADEGKAYADETTFAGVTLRFSHTLERLETGGTRVVHRLEVDGPAADQIGPAVSEDFPEAMSGLLARVEL